MSKKKPQHHEEPVEPVDETPTPEQAREMFKERPDLASVVTTEGLLHRDGT